MQKAFFLERRAAKRYYIALSGADGCAGRSSGEESPGFTGQDAG